ncbi:hypothetical protein TWF696_006911 [Orbilia brochopaga]|uniref:Secreted protein n=1 Tax=Orbilia brochopaga TaxID=3140254 RepID=A0AAV9UUJ8_9PEZI
MIYCWLAGWLLIAAAIIIDHWYDCLLCSCASTQYSKYKCPEPAGRPFTAARAELETVDFPHSRMRGSERGWHAAHPPHGDDGGCLLLFARARSMRSCVHFSHLIPVPAAVPSEAVFRDLIINRIGIYIS